MSQLQLDGNASAASQEQAKLSEAIRAYLAANFEAMDTQIGIAEWWLSGSPDPEVLAKVLRELVRQGVLEEVPSGALTLYRRMRKVQQRL